VEQSGRNQSRPERSAGPFGDLGLTVLKEACRKLRLVLLPGGEEGGWVFPVREGLRWLRPE
jgi:hypothetical protein